MSTTRLNGLVAATYTPLNCDGSLRVAVIPDLVEHLLSQGVSGLYVCGSTGEGMSLSSSERRDVATAFVDAVSGRVPVIVQVGHNSIKEAHSLAEHAQSIGADMVSATCPSYFPVGEVETLIACMADIASGAPELPFYYYHIPALTGSAVDVTKFMEIGGDQIENLVGLKYTDTKLYEFQTCLEMQNGRFDVVWGCDEMLLGALATGAGAAIGSTYNVAAPLYRRIMDAFDTGNIDQARRWQSRSIRLIQTLNQYPFHAAMKALLGMTGFDVGGCRLPQARLSSGEIETLRSELGAIGYFEWSKPESGRIATFSN